MKLFATSFWIAFKHSSRRLLCLLCVFLVCAGLCFAVAGAIPQAEQPRAVVAIRNLDQNPLSRMALQSVASMDNLEGLFEVKLVSDAQQDLSDYTAVVTIPDGFLESVLNGGNLSPLVEVDASSPLEAMWVRQMAQAGAQSLTNAQLGIYAVQEGIRYGADMPAQQYNLLLAQINLKFMNAFMGRISQIESQTLSASGALTLPEYYLTALACLLFFAYGFLYMPSVDNLRRFSRGLGGRVSLFAAAYAHICALTLAAVLPLALFAGKQSGFTARDMAAMLLFALLISAFALALSLITTSRAACAAGCILLAIGMGLCAGGFLPLALMPDGFGAVARLTPFFYARQLAATLFGEPLTGGIAAQSACATAALLGAAALLWYRTMREVVR